MEGNCWIQRGTVPNNRLWVEKSVHSADEKNVSEWRSALRFTFCVKILKISSEFFLTHIPIDETFILYKWDSTIVSSD